jgi:hypothetical protein
VVSAVGSGDAVRQCVTAFESAKLLDNLEAIGIVDRDYRSEEQVKALAAIATVLPFHEIEALVCLPAVGNRLAAHLAVTLDGGIERIVRKTVTDDDVRRVAHERTKFRLLNLVEDEVTAKPSTWDEAGLMSRQAEVKKALGSIDPKAIFEEELSRAEGTRASGDVGKILELFPSKQIASTVAGALGVKVRALFELLSAALSSASGDDPLYQLGKDLETGLGMIGLPPRTVAERSQDRTA